MLRIVRHGRKAPLSLSLSLSRVRACAHRALNLNYRMYLRRGLITRSGRRDFSFCAWHIAATLRLDSGRELYREVTRNNADKEFNYRIIGVTADSSSPLQIIAIYRFLLSRPPFA